MKALVLRGRNTIKLEDKPKPTIQEPTGAIVKIIYTTICGSDLHILQGHVPTYKEGTTIGHEGVGVIQECGSAVRTFKNGQKVLISCITSCASCLQCKKGMYSHCGKCNCVSTSGVSKDRLTFFYPEKGGGWILGHTVDGTQAEYVRIPLADASLHIVPEGVDERALVMLSDIGPTGYEVCEAATYLLTSRTLNSHRWANTILGWSYCRAGEAGLVCSDHWNRARGTFSLVILLTLILTLLTWWDNRA